MATITLFVQEGKTLDFVNNTGADIPYKTVISSGGRIFVVGENIKSGETGSVHTCGVWELEAENTAAFDFGDTLYWDETGKKLTKTQGTYIAGYAAAPKAEADTIALVKID